MNLSTLSETVVQAAVVKTIGLTTRKGRGKKKPP